MNAFVLAALLASPAFASDGVRTTGPLTDTEFLRLLTCGAAPAGACQMDPVKWADPGKLTLSFGPVPQGYPADKASRINDAVDRALAGINSLGTAVKLRRVAPNDAPSIALRPTLFYENDAVFGEPGVEDGEQIGAGYVYVYRNAGNTLSRGTILNAQDIAMTEINSIVLEEITQSPGLLFDIENPDYEGVSIFAQDSNSVVSLTGQDATALRLHYPD